MRPASLCQPRAIAFAPWLSRLVAQPPRVGSSEIPKADYGRFAACRLVANLFSLNAMALYAIPVDIPKNQKEHHDQLGNPRPQAQSGSGLSPLCLGIKCPLNRHRVPNCQATIIIRRQRQLESRVTMVLLSSASVAPVERSETGATDAGGRNARPSFSLYSWTAAGVSAGAAAALDFFACSTR